jgi:molybdenum cofactor cytidylyltransferase
MSENRCCIAILAAGSSSRFGSPKQLSLNADTTLIDASIAMVKRTEVPYFVVLGAYHEQITQHLANTHSDARFIINENWQQGMASSIHSALDDVQNSFQGLMFVAADQNKLRSKDLTLLLSRWYNSPNSIVAAQYENTKGIPAIFPRRVFPELQTLRGDKGAKSVIMQSENTLAVTLPNAAYDIDTPNDIC